VAGFGRRSWYAHFASSPAPDKWKTAKEALEWLRNNNPSPDDTGMDEPTVRALSKLAGIPLPGGKLPGKSQKKALDEAMNWLRSTNVQRSMLLLIALATKQRCQAS
jgi:hypothetical protein